MNFSLTVFFPFILLQLTSTNVCCLRNSSFFHQLDTSIEDIVAAWKSSESALRRIVNDAMRSAVPSLFNIAKRTHVSFRCASSLFGTTRALAQQKLWAIQMVDSSGKGLDGILSGTTTALGDFDECLSVESPSHNFKGKYCLVDVRFPLPPRPSFSRIEDEVLELKDIMEPGTVGAEMVKLAPYLYINQIRIALCVPSTCSAQEVESITQRSFENFNLHFNVGVPYCEIQEKMPYTTGEILIIILFAVLITMVTCSTIIDISLTSRSEDFASSEKSTSLKCILCFSAYTNFLKLLKKDNNPDTLSIFHGLRVITLCWIILCHTYFTVNFHAHDGLMHIKDMPKGFWFSPVINGILSVETFFFMSSVLVSYLCMRIREKVNAPLFFLKRYWRLTPPLMLVTALVVVAGHFGSGPLWRETFIENLSNQCKRIGWWNMFYINNFFPMGDKCMIWTWYLSADTQLFVISLYIVILLRRNAKKGFVALLIILLIGVVWTSFITVYYNLPPVYLQSFFNYDDWHEYAHKAYTPAQAHLPIVSIGLSVGYVLALKKIHIPKKIDIIGWIATAITMPSVVFGVYYWNQGNVPGVLVSAIYAPTQRVLWGLCMAFITLSCTTKKKGIVYSILSWEGFVPLSRLSYVAYLIHYLFIYYYTATVRSTYALSHKNSIYFYFSYVTLTFSVACPLSLVIESPFMSLEKVLTNREAEKKVMPVGFMNGLDEKSLKESA